MFQSIKETLSTAIFSDGASQEGSNGGMVLNGDALLDGGVAMLVQETQQGKGNKITKDTSSVGKEQSKSLAAMPA
eukprot:CAMPEP_0115702622 /NCGR_PEP_ID=MMETSP0272-20121206/68646_1 /TAXON_ID=71861 /ORGANISM="Scrippsiella trochoidea, Strain CCMP3099" /LENGTH=74 /DNA_ID=CAMNT_0003143397 /DNA_START=140 /DNA_END=361 /DNA_ORIENTATION=+